MLGSLGVESVGVVYVCVCVCNVEGCGPKKHELLSGNIPGAHRAVFKRRVEVWQVVEMLGARMEGIHLASRLS